PHARAVHLRHQRRHALHRVLGDPVAVGGILGDLPGRHRAERRERDPDAGGRGLMARRQPVAGVPASTIPEELEFLIITGLSGGILDGIRTERRRLQPLKEQAHKIIDTSTLTAKELKEELADTFVRTDGRRTLAVTVTTFGYKYGIPLDADLVFDVRFLPNP